MCELGAGHELNECLSSAATALEGELRPDLTAEAQRWYLAALADDPRNVEALVGLARTCQELVSNPWWGDPLAASVASDLGREVVAIALNLAPGAADAHCVQGMLHSAAGKLDEAALAFDRALAMDQGLAIAHGFAAYNAAFLGSRRKYAAGDRTCDASRPSRPAAQHLVFLWRFCRIAHRPDRRVDCLAPEVFGTQSQLRQCANVPDRGLIAERPISRSGRGRRVVSPAISRWPRGSVRAVMAIAFAIRNLPSPDPSGIRHNPEPRGGNLIAAHTTLKQRRRFTGRRPAAHLYILTTATAPHVLRPHFSGRAFPAAGRVPIAHNLIK